MVLSLSASLAEVPESGARNSNAIPPRCCVITYHTSRNPGFNKSKLHSNFDHQPARQEHTLRQARHNSLVSFYIQTITFYIPSTHFFVAARRTLVIDQSQLFHWLFQMTSMFCSTSRLLLEIFKQPSWSRIATSPSLVGDISLAVNTSLHSIKSPPNQSENVPQLPQ